MSQYTHSQEEAFERLAAKTKAIGGNAATVRQIAFWHIAMSVYGLREDAPMRLMPGVLARPLVKHRDPSTVGELEFFVCEDDDSLREVTVDDVLMVGAYVADALT